MRVLITGITGFAGSHLAEYILARHPAIEVFGIVRWRSRMENILAIRDKVELCEADLKDMVSLQGCLAHIRPDRIFHLAAQSFVPTSWKCPAETFAINSTGQINLFESLLSLKQSPLVQVAGSSEEYGRVFPDEIPMKETNPLRPLSPYAVSKVARTSWAISTSRATASPSSGPAGSTTPARGGERSLLPPPWPSRSWRSRKVRKSRSSRSATLTPNAISTMSVISSRPTG